MPVDERLILPIGFHAPDAEQRIEALLDGRAADRDLRREQPARRARVAGAAPPTAASSPRDVSLVAFDDVPWMTMVEPRITAVAQPTFEMGRRAARLLLRRADEPDVPAALVRLEPALIVRGSTAPPASPQLLTSAPTGRLD